MKLNGEIIIAAPRAVVWRVLNDEALLIGCIAGCETLERVSDTDLVATLIVKIGPMKVRFKGDIRLENVNAPIRYRLVGEGKGTAGFARGHADVVLEELDGGRSTKLLWVAEADAGRKLARMGARLIDSTARKYADDFFSRFSVLTLEQAAAVEATSPTVEPADTSDAPVESALLSEADTGGLKKPALSPLIWVSAVTFAVLALLYVLVR